MNGSDYVVVGGGSAGAVVAARLAEDPRIRVTLLEAGGSSDRFMVNMPAGFAAMLTKPRYDWCYMQEPDASLNGRRFMWSAGKMLGGSSAINGLVYIRGTRADHQRWVDAGCTGWSFEECLPYFLKAEGYAGAPSQFHGAHGPLGVEDMADPHPMSRRFVDACAQSGIPALGEYCDGGADGAFLSLTTQRGARRSSTAAAYLAPAAQLAAHGIAVLADRAEVGQGLQEHPTVSINKFVSVDTYNSRMKPWHVAGSLLTYLLKGKGPMATPAVQAMALARSRDGLAEPDLQLHFYPVGYDLGPELLSAAAAKMPSEPVVTIGASVGNPHSRGEVLLAGAGAKDLPLIRHELIGDPRDVATLVGACKLIERIFAAPALAQFVTADRNPARIPGDDSGWEAHVRANTNISYHPVGTCRMGSDASAVVTPHLRVRGVAGLRIADASVIPLLPRANTNASAIMIGERAAEFIRQASPVA